MNHKNIKFLDANRKCKGSVRHFRVKWKLILRRRQTIVFTWGGGEGGAGKLKLCLYIIYVCFLKKIML
jgi:hypothetical protein